MQPIARFFLTLTLSTAVSLHAAVKYWDVNGATAGSGQAAATGTWNTTGSLWTTDPTGASATTTFAAGDIAVFSAGTDATGNFIISGTGVTAGGLTVKEGTVSLTGTAVPLGTGVLTVVSNATFSIPNSVNLTASAGAAIILTNGTLRNTVATTAGSFVTAGFTTMTLTGSNTLNFNSANILNILNGTPHITGTGSLSKTGLGVLAIVGGGSNDYSGGTYVISGELRVRTFNNTLPTNTDLTIYSQGIFNLNGLSNQVASLTGNGAVGTCGGELTVAGASSPAPFLGSINDVTNGGAGGLSGTGGKLRKTGAGTLAFGGSNTFTGKVTLDNGAIVVLTNGVLCGAVADLIVNQGALTLSNSAQTIENLSGTGGQINLGSGHTLTSVAAANTTFAGKLSGDGAFAYNSTGFKLILQGNNDYAGGTVVKAGTLEVQKDGGLGGGNVTVQDGTTLLLDGGATNGYIASSADVLLTSGNSTLNLNFTGTNTVNRLSFDNGGTFQPAGVYGAVGSGAPNTSSHIIGTGFLNVTTGPTVVLLSFDVSASGRSLTWNGNYTLQMSTNVASNWVDVLSAVSPYVLTPSNSYGFFRLRQ